MQDEYEHTNEDIVREAEDIGWEKYKLLVKKKLLIILNHFKFLLVVIQIMKVMMMMMIRECVVVTVNMFALLVWSLSTRVKKNKS